jgi:hypothetical protein
MPAQPTFDERNDSEERDEQQRTPLELRKDLACHSEHLPS